MAGRPSVRRLVLAAAFVFAFMVGDLAVSALADQQTLTVAVAVCPADAVGDDLPAECHARLARAFDVSVYDAAYAPLADDVGPDARGQAAVNLTGRTPADLTVVIHPAVNVGTRSVVCLADGTALATALVGGAAAIPVFSIKVGTAADIACTVAIYGFPDDDRLLATVIREATPLATPLATPASATPIVRLPSTGSGGPRRCRQRQGAYSTTLPSERLWHAGAQSITWDLNSGPRAALRH